MVSSYSYNPSSGSPDFTTTLTVTISDSASPGTYKIYAHGSSAEWSQTSPAMTIIVEEEPRLVISSVEITSDSGRRDCFVVGAKDEITIFVMDAKGNPVTGAHVTMEIEHWVNSFSFVETGSGKYVLSEESVGFDLTDTLEIYTITVTANKDGFIPCKVTRDVPSLVPQLFFIEPLEGWAIDPQDYYFIKVDGVLYLAFSALKDPIETSMGIASHTWLIIDKDGYLIRDAYLYKKASMTSEMAFLTKGAKKESLSDFLGEAADYWRELPTYATIAEALGKIRDLGSKALGIIASFYVSAPASVVKLTSTATYKTVTLVLNTAIDAAKKSADAFRYAEMTAAFICLEDAARKADQASSILDRQEGFWNHDLAENFYTNYREAILTGIESMVLCTEVLPDGDAFSQIKSVLTNFASGLLPVDVAVEELIDLDEPLRKAIETRGKFESLFGPADAAWTTNADRVRGSFPSNDKIADVNDLLQEANAIETGNVGASLIVRKSSSDGEVETISYGETYFPGIDVEVQSTIGKVIVKVSSEIPDGKTLIINIDDKVLHTSDVRDVLVLYDNEKIGLADDYADVLNPNDEDVPEYLILVGRGGIQVLISIPHFSIHKIEVVKLETVEVIVKGLPAEFYTRIYLDRAPVGEISCCEPKSFKFEYGKSHIISVDKYIPVNQNIRYVCPSNTVNITAPTKIEFEYSIQYYLTIDTPHGNPQGEGWYDAGSTAILIVEKSIPMDGLLGLLGAKWVFSRWGGDLESTNPITVVVMDTTKQVEILWKEDYFAIYIEVIAVTVVTCLALYLRRRMR